MLRITRLISIAAMLAALMASMLSAPQVKAASDFSDIDATITKLMAMYDVPGVGLAIVRDGKVLYTKGYGYGNVANKQTVTADTEFAIGSVTKSFTALDVGQLVDAGKIDLDTPVITYLPDFKLSDPDATKTLTVRQVISHSSGLPRYDAYWVNKVPASRKQVIDDMKNIPMTAKPGAMWQYCNQNFVLAGYLVEKITGQTWEDYTQQHIFNALGMKSANFSVEVMQKAPDFALPYQPDVLNDYAAVPFSNEMYQGVQPMGPAGSINANVSDLAQYMLFQLGDGTSGTKQIVSKKLLDEMHTQQISLKGSTEGDLLGQLSLTSDIGYGFAWLTESYRGYRFVQHDGAIVGYTASVTLVPSEKLGVTILTNTGGANLFLEAARLNVLESLLGLKSEQNIADTINKRYQFDPVEYQKDVAAAKSYKADAAALKALEGNYVGIVGKVSVTATDKVLNVKIDGQIKQDVTLVPYADNQFLVNGALGTILSFKADDKQVMGVYQKGTLIAQHGDTQTYADPGGQFTVQLPTGWTAQQIADLGVVQVNDPQGTIVFAAESNATDDLKTLVKNWLLKYKQISTEEPINIRDVPINGLTWTQYLYTLADGELLAVVATKQANAVYFVSIKGKQDAVTTLSPNLNSLVMSFKISK